MVLVFGKPVNDVQLPDFSPRNLQFALRLCNCFDASEADIFRDQHVVPHVVLKYYADFVSQIFDIVFAQINSVQ